LDLIQSFQGSYGLPQAGISDNNLLRSLIVAEGYYKAKSTPGLWHHKWHPIQFCLIIDDFGVEYIGLEYCNHLNNVLKKFHGVQFNMAGNKFVGIAIKWNYTTCQCCISMPSYIKNLLINFKNPCLTKPCLSMHKCLPVAYGAKAQLTPTANTLECLDIHRTCHIQKIVELLLYYARAVDNKLWDALSAIAAHQSYPTVATKQAVHLLLDYVATYPSEGIIY
jgi:hypothetical protein